MGSFMNSSTHTKFPVFLLIYVQIIRIWNWNLIKYLSLLSVFLHCYFLISSPSSCSIKELLGEGHWD